MMTQTEAALNGSLKRVRMLCFIFDVNHLIFYKIQGHYCNLSVSDEKLSRIPLKILHFSTQQPCVTRYMHNLEFFKHRL